VFGFFVAVMVTVFRVGGEVLSWLLGKDFLKKQVW
jgi:hypothetical protein